MKTVIRLVWKQHRFELVATTVAIVLLTGAALLTAARLNEIRPTNACLTAWLQSAQNGPGCVDVRPWLDRLEHENGRLTGFFMFLPLISGVLLGSVLVSREIEHRTTQLAWSLSGSRSRWLLERVLPLAVFLAVLLLGLAISGELLQQARAAGADPRASLEDYGLRGLPVVMRGVAVFALAVLVGAVVGRQLPALIVSVVLAGLVTFALLGVFPFGAPSIWVAADTSGSPQIISSRDRWIGYGYQAPDGTVYSFAEAAAQAPDQTSEDARDQWLSEHFTAVANVVTGDHITEIELRESAVLAVFTILAIGASLIVVARRRPY